MGGVNSVPVIICDKEIIISSKCIDYGEREGKRAGGKPT
jgi:hypothetical protein